MANPVARPETTRLSTNGQLILPKEIRERHGWTAGTELIVEDHGNSVVLRQVEDLPATTLEDLIGCAGYEGPARSSEEMEAGIARGARESR
jgi:AbrB family looped-hinge helix DNA binding protein